MKKIEQFLNVYRCVHTNLLKCKLDQITSSHIESICICSIHTLFTESEFDYRLSKIYCEVHNNNEGLSRYLCNLGCNNRHNILFLSCI